jgi:hypothetical protein
MKIRQTDANVLFRGPSIEWQVLCDKLWKEVSHSATLPKLVGSKFLTRTGRL